MREVKVKGERKKSLRLKKIQSWFRRIVALGSHAYMLCQLGEGLKKIEDFSIFSELFLKQSCDICWPSVILLFAYVMLLFAYISKRRQTMHEPIT